MPGDLGQIRDFAASHVAPRPELHQTRDFPQDLWRAMADAGLLGIGLAPEYGGEGGDFKRLAQCCTALTEAGGNLGVTMTWMAHNLNARLHIGSHGTAQQKSDWLVPIARGETTLSIAISEPGIGAHPKHLKCRADRDGDDYVLNGEKAYLTNGPLAGVFLVLAITGEEDGRKQFSAFLVPRDSAGFEQTPGVEIDFLHPSPHCGIRLTDCRIPATNMLGEAGTAFARVSLKMRAAEDALATASQAGGYRYLLGRLADALEGEPSADALAELGRMSTNVEALVRLSLAQADDLDGGLVDGDHLDPLSAGFREFADQLQIRMDDFINDNQLTLDQGFASMRDDLIKSRSIAQSVHQARAIQYGRALLSS